MSVSNSSGDSATFVKRHGTTDKGRDYEDVITALISFNLVNNEQVENFQLAANHNNFDKFDDVVLTINYKNEKNDNMHFNSKIPRGKLRKIC
jgi:hypothetical protein